MDCSINCSFTHNRTKEHLLYHIKNKIPTNLTFAEKHLLPDRQDYLDQSLVETFAKFIKAEKPILFLPNDITEPKVWECGKEVYKPHLYGILPCGTKICVILQGINVFFDVKLPDEPNIICPVQPDKISKKNEEFIEKIHMAAVVSGITIRTEVTYLFPANRHSLVKHPYLRIFFDNLKARDDFYNTVKRENPNVVTSSDDKSIWNKVSYFSKAAREYKYNTADWNRIEKYKVVYGKTTCTYTLIVNADDMKPLSLEKRKAIQENVTTATNIALGKAIDYDNTIIAQWDIETKGELPNYDVGSTRNRKIHFKTDKFVLFMMNTSYFMQWSNDPLVDICCVDHELSISHSQNENEETKNTLITIVCGSERNVLEAHMFVLSKMKPDITSAFNGGNFDWPIYREKLYQYSLLGALKRSLSCYVDADKYYTNESTYDYSFKDKVEIKLSAERTHVMKCVALFPGMIDTDVMLNFLKIYSRAEISKAGSLNFFLNDNKLPSKEDMPYKRMFKIHDRACELVNAPKICHCASNESINCTCCKSIIPMIDCIEDETKDHDDPSRYSDILIPELVQEDKKTPKCCACGKRPRNLRDMELVAIYCMIDCRRPQQLNNKRAIIGDKRALANLSFVPLYNAFYFADGEKVRNMMGAYCYDYGVAFSNITLSKGDHEKDHNVGGYVVTPKRGLYRVPVTGLDFESLYPSLIATYNLSPDMIVDDPAYADYLRSAGYTLHAIVDESGTHLRYTRGEKKDDPNNQVIESVAWSVRHNGILTDTDQNIITGYDDNLQPIYGRPKLPNERLGYMAYIVKMLKELRRPVKAKLVQYSMLLEELEIERDEHLKKGDKVKAQSLEHKIEETAYMVKKYTSQSNSIKVLNNTFYGQVSSFRNSFYDINIAGGITAAGRRNLKLVKGFVENKGFHIAYGDSVTADTPILCRIENKIIYRTIEDLFNDYSDIISIGEKEYIILSNPVIEVWSDQGFTAINKIIRHKTNKKIYRITTQSGIVDVTEDHSLLDVNGNKISPKDIKIGDKLLHHDLPLIGGNINNPDAYKLGLHHRNDIPQEILNYDLESRKNFYNGYCSKKQDKLQEAYLYLLASSIEPNNGELNKIINIQLISDSFDYSHPHENNQKYVYDLETENHHFAAGIGRLIVHNTDSLYITCPNEVYDEIRQKYKCLDQSIVPPEEFYHDMVKIAMTTMGKLKKEVYSMLVKDNGTPFLLMAYEEVGLPTMMMGKKKYAMIAHMKTINFRPDEIFIRGLELKKQGQTGVSKQLQIDCLRDILSIEHLRDPMEVSVEHIKRFFTINIDPAQFTKMHSYRPNKKNTTVLRFVERMKKEGKLVPEPGDKFKTVVVLKPQEFTIRGTMIKSLIGDKLEYLHEFTKNNMQLDLNYYLDGGIYGAFARYIAYHESFQMQGLNMSDPKEYKQGDEHSVKQAYAYLERICSAYITKNTEQIKSQAKLLKSEYNLLAKVVNNKQYDKTVMTALSRNSGGIKATDKDLSHPMIYMEKLRDNIRKDHTNEFAKRFVTKSLKKMTIYDLKRTFDFKVKNILYTRLENNMFMELVKFMPQVWQISDEYKKRIEDAVTQQKNGINTQTSLSDDEQTILRNADKMIAKFRAIIFCKKNMISIDQIIAEEITKKADIEYVPRLDVRSIAKDESKLATVIDDFNFP